VDSEAGFSPWFALMVKSRHEKAVAAALRGKGYPEFLPLVEQTTRSAGHNRTVQLPLFPMYQFCRLDPFRRMPVLTIPGVLSIVSVGNVPAPVDESEIEAIQQLVRSSQQPLACGFIELGEVVEVISGPLQGLQGILQEIRGKWRLVLSVTLLRRSVSVETDIDSVRRVVPRFQPGRSTPIRQTLAMSV
jgi:transcription antitermination factor NusG